jgi:predicted metalloprotease with PDZ domain
MTVRLSHFLVAALLLVTAVYADDRKLCTSSPKECEQAIRELSSGRRYLGAQIEELNPGIIIKAVIDDGPAYHADLRPGDRLMAVNGRSTLEANIKDFKQILYTAKETGVLWIIIKRSGVLMKVDVRLAPYSKAQIDKMVAQHLWLGHGISPTVTATSTAPQQ